MNNPYDNDCIKALEELNNNKEKLTSISFVKNWLLKYELLRKNILINYPLAGKPVISIGGINIPAIQFENIEQFFLVYRNLIDLPKYHQYEMVASQALIEYQSIINSGSDEVERITKIKNWLLQYENLGTRNLYSSVNAKTFVKYKTKFSIILDKTEFKSILAFNKIFELQYFENALLPERMNLFISTPTHQQKPN
jgi:hypothetical protein